MKQSATRALTGSLFLLGCVWALTAWLLVLAPLGMFMPRYEYHLHDIVLSVLGGSIALAGYGVWIGWGFFTFTGRFPLLTWRRFWFVALVQHCGWLLFFPVFRGESFVHFVSSPEVLGLKIWIFANIIVAALCVLAQPGAAPDTGSAEPAGNPEVGGPATS